MNSTLELPSKLYYLRQIGTLINELTARHDIEWDLRVSIVQMSTCTYSIGIYMSIFAHIIRMFFYERIRVLFIQQIAYV